MWSLILFMFFLMLRKSNVMPESTKSFDSRKQLIRQDIQVHDNMLTVNMKWSKTRQFWASSSNSYSSYAVEYSLSCDGIQEYDQNSRCRSFRSFILYLFGQ